MSRAKRPTNSRPPRTGGAPHKETRQPLMREREISRFGSCRNPTPRLSHMLQHFSSNSMTWPEVAVPSSRNNIYTSCRNTFRLFHLHLAHCFVDMC